MAVFPPHGPRTPSRNRARLKGFKVLTVDAKAINAGLINRNVSTVGYSPVVIFHCREKNVAPNGKGIHKS